MMIAAWDLPLGSTDKLVLLALADHVNQKDVNVCYPGIQRLCERTGLSDRAIHKSLKRLKEAGHIEVIHRHRHASRFSLNLVPSTPNVVRVNPERSSLNPEPRSLRTCKESEYEPARNLRAESVIDAMQEKTPETGVFERREPKRARTLSEVEDRLETASEREQSRRALQMIRERLTVISGDKRGNDPAAEAIAKLYEPWGGRKNPLWDTPEGKELTARAKAIGYRDMSPHEDLEHYRMVIEQLEGDRVEKHGNERNG